MTRKRARLFLTVVAVIVVGVVSAAGQQLVRSDSYTAEQFTAGRAAYLANCAACHMPDLKGSNEALPLAGPDFMNTWRSRTTRDLFNRISTSMPPGKLGSVGEQDVVAIVAFILQSNGATPGTNALTAATAIGIGELAGGETPVAVSQEISAQTAARSVAAARPASPAAPVRRGVWLAIRTRCSSQPPTRTWSPAMRVRGKRCGRPVLPTTPNAMATTVVRM